MAVDICLVVVDAAPLITLAAAASLDSTIFITRNCR